MSKECFSEDRDNIADSNRWLNQFARNVTSQCGEDGIIEKILDVLGDNNKWCVEFGAWDGKHLSNTFNLIQNKGYSAVLIEADTDRFNHLVTTHRSNQRVVLINALVGFEEHNSLDVHLRATDTPYDFDLLSIDVDGNDYHCWKSILQYRPKVVVIEFNPTIPNAVEFVQKPDMKVTQGSSILSICKLAKSQRYELVAVTPINAIFVDSKYYDLFGIKDNSVHVMRADQSEITYLFSGYDGTVFLAGSRRLSWHGIPFGESQMQLLPKWLRQYPENYGRIKRAVAKVYRGYRHLRFLLSNSFSSTS